MVQPVKVLSEDISKNPLASAVIRPTVEIAETASPIVAPKKAGQAWKRWLYRLISTAILAGIGTGLYWTKSTWLPKLDALIRPNANAEKPKPRPPLVTFVEATQERVPQYINCLGTVTAFNSVVVRSRVDGELTKIEFEEGQHVEADQLLAEIDPRAFVTARDQAAAQLQRDTSALELAKMSYERLKQLPIREALSQQEFDEAYAAYKEAAAAVAVSQSQLANAELQLAYTKITAPISGSIGLRLMDKGNMVKASDSNGLLVITQLNPISVVFPIPQDEIPRVRKRLANSTSTEVLAYDRSFRNLLATGKLSALDNQVDAATGTLKLKATFDNEANMLFPNQFVNIRLLVDSREDAVVVPTSAIQRGPDFNYVYVVGDDSTVDIQKVMVAFNEDNKSVIESGVSAGQKVVTEGTDRLQPKGKVTLPGQGGPRAEGSRGGPGAPSIESRGGERAGGENRGGKPNGPSGESAGGSAETPSGQSANAPTSITSDKSVTTAKPTEPDATELSTKASNQR